MKLGEAIYKSDAENTQGNSEEPANNNDDDIFDADFEDLTDDEKK
jgi:hypothetical protein